MKIIKKIPLYFLLLSLSFVPILVLAAGKIDQKFVNKFRGRILLQVQGHGEAWYLNPVDGRRYYLKDGAAAYELMRKFGQGMSNGDLEKIPVGILEGGTSSEKQTTTVNNTENPQDDITSNAVTTPQQRAKTQQTALKEEPQEVYYTVTRVIDGDTFDVSLNGITQRVRAIGLDTPEVVDPRKPVQCFGKESSGKASELLLNKKVRLESDPSQGDRDIYNRLLRYVYRDEGLFFNKAMIEGGFGSEYTYNIPYKYQADFRAAQQTAREKQLGLWSPGACSATSSTGSVSQPAASNGTTTESSQSVSQNTTQKSDGHTWYTSSHSSARFYYCDTDPTWQGLSSKYLQRFSSEGELLSKYQRTLHEPCK